MVRDANDPGLPRTESTAKLAHRIAAAVRRATILNTPQTSEEAGFSRSNLLYAGLQNRRQRLHAQASNATSIRNEKNISEQTTIRQRSNVRCNHQEKRDRLSSTAPGRPRHRPHGDCTDAEGDRPLPLSSRDIKERRNPGHPAQRLLRGFSGDDSLTAPSIASIVIAEQRPGFTPRLPELNTVRPGHRARRRQTDDSPRKRPNDSRAQELLRQR
ncbi:hypothetical protein [Amycolatopsis sp. NPDC054798]